MSQRQLWMVLAGLVVVLIGGLSYQVSRGAFGGSLLGGDDEAQPPPVSADQLPTLANATPGVNAGELFERPKRDLFDYGESPEDRARRLAEEEAARKAAEEAARKRREEEERRRKAEEERRRREREAELERQRLAALRAQERANEPPPPPPPPKAPPPPEPPVFAHRYVGLIGPRDDAVAILTATSSGEEESTEASFVYARKGQVLEDEFKIERVGQLQLVVSYTDPLFADDVELVPLQRDANASLASARAVAGGDRPSRDRSEGRTNNRTRNRGRR
ncbi:MAG: hypothetical protein AAF533_26750 [Acidobacteriota bacterium]